MIIRGNNIPIWKIPYKAATHVYHGMQDKCRNLRATHYLKTYDSRIRAHKKKGIIRVGFIAQMPEIWDKQMDLFQYLLQDERFDPVILYVKEYDLIRKTISAEGKNEISFYTDLYGTDHVIDFLDHADLDLSAYDYLFYDRAYNNYLPHQLHSYNTVKTNRICLVNYTCRDFAGQFGSKDFAPEVYMWFASCQWEYDIHNEEYRSRPLNKIFDVGYPAFETYHALKTTEGKNRILWTPRWTYSEKLGRSHFFEYIDSLIQYAVKHPEVTVTIRPHPMMFDNLIAEKQITPEEVFDIQQRCKENGVLFDQNRLIADTFTETDILLSDYSSVVKLFCVMDKPIVYCPTNVPLNEEFVQMTETMYLSDSWEDIEKNLDRLITGDDPLKEKRQEYISKYLLRKKNTVKEIANILYQDYWNGDTYD